MSFEPFNRKKNEGLLNTAYDRINKKFDTDRGKAIIDYIVKISEPFLYGFSVEKFLRDLFIRDLDEFCESRNITTVEKFKRGVIDFTELFCFKMNDINAPLF